MNQITESVSGFQLQPCVIEKEIIVGKYVLVTAACNEQDYIGKVIQTVVSQTVLPMQWIIVVNGSTDNTADIVKLWEEKLSWLKLIDLNNERKRDFALKVAALETGIKSIFPYIDYDFLGILDADITLPNNYYQNIISIFNDNPQLGVAGGVLNDVDENGRLIKRYGNSKSVPGGVQMFRRECWSYIGGLQPLKWGGEDTVAEITARMGGWLVKSYDSIIGLHHRKTNTAGKKYLQTYSHLGIRDFHIGVHHLFEIVKCIRRISEKPMVLASICRLIGYFSCLLKNEKRILPKDLVHFYKKEQLHRLFKFIKLKDY